MYLRVIGDMLTFCFSYLQFFYLKNLIQNKEEIPNLYHLKWGASFNRGNSPDLQIPDSVYSHSVYSNRTQILKYIGVSKLTVMLYLMLPSFSFF